MTFGLEYRLLPGRDEGLCIHIYGNAISGQDKELLRFDCFAAHPHYHYRNATVRQNERLELDCTAEGDPLTWTLDKIKHRLPAMLMRCEAENIARDMDQRNIDAALPKIATWADAPRVVWVEEDQTPVLSGPDDSGFMHWRGQMH